MSQERFLEEIEESTQVLKVEFSNHKGKKNALNLLEQQNTKWLAMLGLADAGQSVEAR